MGPVRSNWWHMLRPGPVPDSDRGHRHGVGLEADKAGKSATGQTRSPYPYMMPALREKKSVRTSRRFLRCDRSNHPAR
jgi:hypothetical protein